ncbi:tyrosine-type recombinase/integrase [Comamonas testosteroni]|uniref:tyrosine-type recombinase/integrase n=1 Tax=Comamonas testosteroni TaxID=285 RepID=UPI00076C4ECF|nr:site-specific integrase [Comamonas testosteroni]KWT73015.1 Site-specific recombinase XerD [Comamonas testosteroni]
MNTSDVEIFFVRGDSSGIRVGAPVFFSHGSGSVIPEPTHYLRERFVESGRSSAATTWRGTAYRLAAWWDYLAAREISWDQATRQDLVKFRDFFIQNKNPATGGSYASGTIGHYVSTVIDFYRYFYRKGLYFGSIFDENLSNKNEYFKNKFSLRKRNRSTYSDCSDLIPNRVEEVVVHPYSPIDYRKFTETLRLKNSIRDNLIFKVILMAGLRVSEAANLVVSQFLIETENHPYTYQGIWVIGKGKKRRFVMIPNLLIKEISDYIFEERAISVKKSGVKDMGGLFVTEINSKRPGRKISVRRIQEIHADTCLQAGLTRSNIGQGNNPKETVFPKYRVHDLRHTYAVWSYHILKSLGDPEPWKFIQAQLGHKHMDTTINIYLKHVALLDSKVPMANLQEVMGW